jgi:hypothetical protein
MNASEQGQPDNQRINLVFHGSLGRGFTELILLSSGLEVDGQQTKNGDDGTSLLC